MGLTLELPEESAAAPASEAGRLGPSLPEYAARLPAAASAKPEQVRNGAELTAYRRAEGIVGSRGDSADAPAHARSLRRQAERRDSGEKGTFYFFWKSRMSPFSFVLVPFFVRSLVCPLFRPLPWRVNMKLIQRFRMISVCVAAAAAFTAIGMQAAPQRVVTAEEFRLTDRDGRIRARLVSTDEAGVALYLISAEGQLRGVLGVDAKGRPSLRLFNTANVPGLRLTVDTETPDSRPSVEMTYGDGTPALSILAMERNGLGIQGFGGGTKEPALDIQVVPKGLGKVALRSGDGSIQLMVAPGIQRISAGASKETKGVQIDTSGTLNGIRVFDDAGRDKIRLDVIKGEARVDVAKDEK